MKDYIVTHTAEVRRIFIVEAEDRQEAEALVMEDPDSDMGLLNQYTHQSLVESRELTDEDKTTYDLT